jgi:hypothetical protein
VYLLLTTLFLFKDSAVIRVLKLDKGFAETTLNITYPANNILKIAVIVIAAVTLMDSLPGFCFEMFNFWQQKTFFNQYGRSAYLVFDLVKSVLAFLAMTNSTTIVKWISKKAT